MTTIKMDFETVKNKAMHIHQFLLHLQVRHPEIYKSILKEVNLPNGTLTSMEKIIATLTNISNNGSDSFKTIATSLAKELMPKESTIEAVHTIFNTTLLYVIKQHLDATILYWIYTESKGYDYNLVESNLENLGKKVAKGKVEKGKKKSNKRKRRV
jgi:hypothetical protein